MKPTEKKLPIFDFKYDDLQEFVAKGKSLTIPQNYQKYFEHLVFAYRLLKKGLGRHYAARQLMLTFGDEIGTFRTAINRVADSVLYFNMDEPIDARAMIRHYINDLDTIYALAMQKENLEMAFKIRTSQIEQLKEMETNNIPAELLEYKPVILSHKVNLPEMGFSKINLKELAKEIDSYDIADYDKQRLKREADITDTNYEEIE